MMKNLPFPFDVLPKIATYGGVTLINELRKTCKEVTRIIDTRVRIQKVKRVEDVYDVGTGRKKTTGNYCFFRVNHISEFRVLSRSKTRGLEIMYPIEAPEDLDLLFSFQRLRGLGLSGSSLPQGLLSRLSFLTCLQVSKCHIDVSTLGGSNCATISLPNLLTLECKTLSPSSSFHLCFPHLVHLWVLDFIVHLPDPLPITLTVLWICLFDGLLKEIHFPPHLTSLSIRLRSQSEPFVFPDSLVHLEIWNCVARMSRVKKWPPSLRSLRLSGFSGEILLPPQLVKFETMKGAEFGDPCSFPNGMEQLLIPNYDYHENLFIPSSCKKLWVMYLRPYWVLPVLQSLHLRCYNHNTWIPMPKLTHLHIDAFTPKQGPFCIPSTVTHFTVQFSSFTKARHFHRLDFTGATSIKAIKIISNAVDLKVPVWWKFPTGIPLPEIWVKEMDKYLKYRYKDGVLCFVHESF
jgi:hypothetical protein